MLKCFTILFRLSAYLFSSYLPCVDISGSICLLFCSLYFDISAEFWFIMVCFVLFLRIFVSALMSLFGVKLIVELFMLDCFWNEVCGKLCSCLCFLC